MYAEDRLLPLSALQHIMYCERQCALIHLEQVWSENRLTVEGRHLHERVDARGGESRGEVRTEFGVFVRSLRLGVSGIADAVEFHHEDGGLWRPFPVEYKRGRPKKGHSDEVQLCAQAMCLEEMLDLDVPEGALFYGKTRRRAEVCFDASLKALTQDAAGRLHELVDSETTPPADFGPKCRNCSLKDACMPRLTEDRDRVNGYLAAATHEGDAT
jgi:CRISPR-associated exonuclease Cas4